MQFERPVVLSPILTQDVNLAASDLVSLDGVLLSMERAHVADEGLGDFGR
jgi:hypothetical protein